MTKGKRKAVAVRPRFLIDDAHRAHVLALIEAEAAAETAHEIPRAHSVDAGEAVAQ
ncbi:MAG: hypothetical protein AAF962_18975 [Actinomycetota bacterium]